MSTAKKFSEVTENTAPRYENILIVDANGHLQQVSAINMTKALMYSTTTYVEDFNEATEPGLYCTHGSNNPANSPTGVSTYCSLLEVFKRGDRFTFQRLIAYSGHICTRICVDGVWRQWNILTMISSGGVKYCTSYARERKGGARYEYARKGIDKRPAERHPDGFSSGKRPGRGFGHMQDRRVVFCRKPQKSSRRCIQLWDAYSIPRPELVHSDVSSALRSKIVHAHVLRGLDELVHFHAGLARKEAVA